MIKVEPHQIEKLTPFFREVVDECAIGDWSSATNMATYAIAITSAGAGAAFVDNMDNPKAIVIVLKGSPNMLYDHAKGGICLVSLVYVTPSERGGGLSDECRSQIEAFARTNQCKRILGGSLRLEGTKSIDNFWEKGGYTPQEKIYVKTL